MRRRPTIPPPGCAVRIFKSSQSDCLRAYCKSSRTISSKRVRLRPFTCHRPVIPDALRATGGGATRRRLPLHRAAAGRGPTSDISPRQHVEELRQLVQAGAPQDASHRQ